MVSRLDAKGDESRSSSIYITPELSIGSRVIEGCILKCILVRIKRHHCVQDIAESSVYCLIFLPRKSSCLTSVFIESKGRGVITTLSIHERYKVGKNNVRVCDFFVPVHSNEAFIVKRLQCTQELRDWEFSLPDKDTFFSVAISKAHIADICTQSLYCSLCTF